MERFTGQESLLWHMADADTPMHTLKVAVLDTARLGRTVTLDDLRRVLPGYLGLVRRSTQKVVALPGFGGRPFWIDDDEFDLDAHLDECTLPGPDRATLDATFAGLAERQLDSTRPQWAMTLVHGLAGERQAVVVRVHHSVCDGLAALNTFLAATTDRPGAVPTPCVPHNPVAAHPKALRRHAVRDSVRLVKGTAALCRDLATSRQHARRFERKVALPGLLPVARSSFSTPSGPHRVCASSVLEIADLRAVARASGTTLNGVLHGIVAGAMRAELLARGESVSKPAVATFGVSADPKSTRRWGNAVAPTSVYLHTEIADPRRRLLTTALSCSTAVEFRRHVGFGLTERLSNYAPRLAPLLRGLLAHRMPRIVNNITTANVAGPAHRRWLGDVAVVEWISFAVAIAPADVNLTCYSYDGTLSMGLVTTPESMPDPAGFLERMRVATAELVAATERGRLYA